MRMCMRMCMWHVHVQHVHAHVLVLVACGMWHVACACARACVWHVAGLRQGLARDAALVERRGAVDDGAIRRHDVTHAQLVYVTHLGSSFVSRLGPRLGLGLGLELADPNPNPNPTSPTASSDSSTRPPSGMSTLIGSVTTEPRSCRPTASSANTLTRSIKVTSAPTVDIECGIYICVISCNT